MNTLGCTQAYPTGQRRADPNHVTYHLIVARVRTEPNGQLVTKCGFIDRAGRSVIPPSFDGAHAFSEGLAAVNVGGRGTAFSSPSLVEATGGLWGFVDRRGTFIVPPQYVTAESFSEGVAAVFDTSAQAYYIDRAGRPAGIVKTGRAIRPQGFSCGLARAQDRQTKLWGFIDKEGRWAIRPEFSLVASFGDSLAVVVTGGALKDGVVSGGKYGFVDPRGEFAVRPRFDCACPFFEGLAAVNVGGRGYDLFAAGGKWGYVDRKGTIIVEPSFSWTVGFSEGLAAVNVGGSTEASLVPVGGLWGFVDRRGKIAISPQFAAAQSFSEGLAAVSLVGNNGQSGTDVAPASRWGFIDKTGKMVIAATFESALSFSHGLAFVYVKGRGQYIDREGRVVWREPDPDSKREGGRREDAERQIP